MKSDWLNQRLRVNAAVFHTEIEDNQFFNFYAGPFGLLRLVSKFRNRDSDVNGDAAHVERVCTPPSRPGAAVLAAFPAHAFVNRNRLNL